MAVAGKGSTSYVHYTYEPVYNTAAADANITAYFGHNVRFNCTPRNNLERIPQLNDRNIAKVAAKKFEGTFGVDFQVSNWYFMKGVIGISGGQTSPTVGVGPYRHSLQIA